MRKDNSVYQGIVDVMQIIKMLQIDFYCNYIYPGPNYCRYPEVEGQNIDCGGFSQEEWLRVILVNFCRKTIRYTSQLCSDELSASFSLHCSVCFACLWRVHDNSSVPFQWRTSDFLQSVGTCIFRVQSSGASQFLMKRRTLPKICILTSWSFMSKEVSVLFLPAATSWIIYGKVLNNIVNPYMQGYWI